MIRKAVILLLFPLLLAAAATVARADPAHRTVVIDAGHGGEDGGAVGTDGTPESGINLQIARRLELLLCFLGQDTVMTRTGEGAVYSPEASTLREKKVSDLQNRVKTVNDTVDGFLISIHQNSLPSHPSVHGAQVFYNALPGADKAAEQVQQYLNLAVNTDKERLTRVIDSSVYLMKNAQCPAILVECGFMSNSGECQRLQEPDYQLRLALVIAAGFSHFSNA